jgi:alkylation response protein AidB-like acyl-CoA dehydrogenase
MIEKAVQISAELLFPAAISVDASDRVPAGHLDVLASEGFYGLAGPPASGGPDADLPAIWSIVEILAGGCLATTFVWMQHHSAVRALAGAPDLLRARWLEPLCRGSRRAGVALAGALPGPPLLRARQVAGGYVLDGTAPWVTGWGMIDVLYTAARDDQDNVVAVLLAAEAGPTLTAESLRMVAVTASSTVQLRFDGHFVPADSVTGISPHRQWLDRDPMRLRANGSLALGVAARCCTMIGPSPLDGALRARRDALNTGLLESMPAARAGASDLAMQAAAALVAVTGSRAILAGEHPQRLAREALFLLVFASRPAIKGILASRLTAARP